MYRRALEADPNNANSLRDYADFLMNVRRDYQGAEALMLRASELDPDDPDEFNL